LRLFYLRRAPEGLVGRPLRSRFEGWLDCEDDLKYREENDAQNHPQPGEYEAEVVTGGAEDDVGGIAGARVMNNFSLLAANRVTHLKVVVVALVFATLAVGIGFAPGDDFPAKTRPNRR
jgi:hypothetical protein